MTTQYTVIQYVPDPVADERVNIGVLVFGDGPPRARFLAKWERVERFAKEDTAYVRDFAARISDSLILLEGLWETLEAQPFEDRLRKMASGLMNSIQFTPLRGSLETPEKLLAQAVSMFLIEYQRQPQGYRNRQQAAVDARVSIRNVLQRAMKSDKATEKYLGADKQLQGRFDKHRFDAVVQNGIPYFAAQALSFEIPDPSHLTRIINATAFQIEDVRKLMPDLPIAIAALPPLQGQKEFGAATDMYDRARRIFEGVKATVLLPSTVGEWASPFVNKLAAAEVAHGHDEVAELWKTG